MKFLMKLDPPLARQPINRADRSTPTDEASLFIDGCEMLEEAGYQFRVAGFGESNWGADVSYDMSILLSQIPVVLNDIASDTTTELHFASQGLERFVDFEINSQQRLTLRCRSGTAWQPDPSVETHHTADVERMMKTLQRDFADALAEVAPSWSVISPIPLRRAAVM